MAGVLRSDSPESSSLAPAISLAKGGGAICGIGGKFVANPLTGTGSFKAPIYTRPGHSVFGPKLSLSYDSDAGNGAFGSEWSRIQSSARKTDKGSPHHQDRTEEPDVFILSCTEDLVRALAQVGSQWRPMSPALPSSLCGLSANTLLS